MNPEILEQVLDCPSLPSLPAVAARVLELTRREDVSLVELAGAIEKDQALAAKVLRTVHSSFYGVRRCTTVHQALVMLGLAAVQSVTLGFSLLTALRTEPGAGFDAVAYWRRGLYTAAAARAIAQRAGRRFGDEAFLGGLLQDIGMMAMHRAVGEAYDRVVAAGHHRGLAARELDELGATHPDIGALLAERWRLPPEIVAPIKYHERPTAAPVEQADLVRAVSLGNAAHDVLTDSDPGAALERLRDGARRWFELGDAAVAEVLGRVAEGAAELTDLLTLDTGAVPDARAAVERALAARAQGASCPAGAAPLAALVADWDRVDPFTGALTRDECLRLAEEAFFAAQSRGRALAVIAIVVDRFGDLVRDHGVEAGDGALVEAAGLLSGRFERAGGIVGRMGEYSLAVLLPGVETKECLELARALRADIASGSGAWRIGGPVTVSVGSAVYQPSSACTGPQQLFSAAIRAAVAASAAGGNCVRAFVPRLAA